MSPYFKRLTTAGAALALMVPAFTGAAAERDYGPGHHDSPGPARHYDDYDRRGDDHGRYDHDERYYRDDQHRGHGRFLYFNARSDRQQERIEQGIRSGALTREEAEKLLDQQRRLDRTMDRFAADGRLTAEERRILEDRYNRASDRIADLKHNDRYRRGSYGYRPGYDRGYGPGYDGP
ncbi:MAG: hypothetical protein PVF91_09675, partial [Chromatiales bacterium]